MPNNPVNAQGQANNGFSNNDLINFLREKNNTLDAVITKCQEYLAAQEGKKASLTAAGKLALQLSISHGLTDRIDALIERNTMLFDQRFITAFYANGKLTSNSPMAKLLLDKAAKHNLIAIFKELLKRGNVPDLTTFEMASAEIKKMLKYRPGKKSPYLFEFCLHPEKYGYHEPQDKVTTIGNIIEDYEDTTEDSSSDSAADIHADLVKKNLFVINPTETQQGYNEIPVAPDGNCGYSAFGITPADAYAKLDALIAEITEILQPALRETLPRADFFQYLVDNSIIDDSISINTVELNLDEFALDITVQRAYLSFDILDKKVDAGYAHPCVLRALAHVSNVKLHLWKKDEQDRLIPYRGPLGFDVAVYTPQHIERRLDLVFVNDNHFNIIEFTGYENNYPLETDIICPLTANGENALPLDDMQDNSLLADEKKRRTTYVKQHNGQMKAATAATADKEEEESPVKPLDTTPQPHILLFRGISWHTNHFNKQKRREMYRLKDRLNQPAISLSTCVEAGIKESLYISTEDADVILQEAEKKEKAFFQSLQEKGLWDKFFEDYICRYAALFNDENNRESFKTKYKHSNGKNPIVSTSISAQKAFYYTGGVRAKNSHQPLNPHYRRFTLKPKHPHLGHLDAYMLDIDYYTLNATSMSQLIHAEKKINVPYILWHDHEVCFVAMLPGKYHIARTVLSLPPLNHRILSRSSQKPKTHNVFSKNPAEKREAINYIVEKVAFVKGEQVEKAIKIKLLRQNNLLLFPVPLPKGYLQSELRSLSLEHKSRYEFPSDNASQDSAVDKKKESLTRIELTKKWHTEYDFLNRPLEEIFSCLQDFFSPEQKTWAVHGLKHAYRTPIGIKVLLQLYCDDGDQEVLGLTAREIKIFLIVGKLHDIGRKQDTGKDEWALASLQKCQRILKEYVGLDPDEAEMYSQLIAKKDDDARQSTLAKIMHDADALEVIRVRSDFYLNRLDCYNDLPEKRQIITKIAQEIGQLIALQGDAKKTCHIRESENSAIISTLGSNSGNTTITTFSQTLQYLTEKETPTLYHYFYKVDLCKNQDESQENISRAGTSAFNQHRFLHKRKRSFSSDESSSSESVNETLNNLSFNLSSKTT